MILTERDNRIIRLLQKQDFCFYKDIANKFFSSEPSASLRLKKLKEKGVIRIEPIYSSSFNKIMDKSSLLFIGGNKKVIRLNNKYKVIKRKPSYWKIKHQLLLFSLKERLEKLLKNASFFENDIRDLKYTLYDRTREPLPDFFIKGEDYKLAIELELHLKSKRRYWLKVSDYNRSSYTHVLYVVTNMKKVDSLTSSFKYYKYMGIAHYSRVDELTSFWYGKISLLEWLNKRIK